MTIEELKAEANKLGYSLVKKPERVPHSKCVCGRRPSVWSGRGTFYICCEKCGRQSERYINEKNAWKNWNEVRE